jgi:glycolate oxidase FAD binding subunit
MNSVDDIADAVRSGTRLRVRGGGSKPNLSRGANLETAALSGILEYDPSEYTFTALAGTTLREVTAMLEAKGQSLPFDPPFVQAGATLGGTVAAGLSGPGRVRYGGVRDFILGVTFVDGLGNVVRAGGKVVKNAAGFDFPKLHCGALGRFGVLTELTFKVFPKPQAFVTLEFEFADFAATLAALTRLLRSQFDFEALELEAPNVLVLRLGGVPDALSVRAKRLIEFVAFQPSQWLERDEDALFWRDEREFSWADRALLIKVPVTPARLAVLEAKLDGLPRQYSAGGQVAWVSCHANELARLEMVLLELGLSGLVVRGETPSAFVGRSLEQGFQARVRQALDPQHKFAPEVQHAT